MSKIKSSAIKSLCMDDYNFIERKIITHPFRCLFCIFFLIFILSFIIITIFELKSQIKSTSRVVIETIHQESERFQYIMKNIEDLNNLTPAMQKYLQNLNKKNFIFIKIIPKNKSSSLIFQTKTSYKLTEALKVLESKFFNNINPLKTMDYVISNKKIYILFIEKIDDIGFIEVIYRVPKKVLKELKNDIFFSIKIIFTILILTFFVMFMLVHFFTSTIRNFNISLLKENIMSLLTVGSMIAKRDSETGDHNYRVTYYAVKIAENFPVKVNIQGLIKGSFLHDIGKIAIPDSILLKPGKLTKEEFEIMKTHVLHGYEIIKDNDFLKDAVDVVLYHHEKFDGSGYMKGLKGNDIPINARIFAVADVFDALTSKRPYKEPYSFEKSMDIIKAERGKHFCPVVVDTFEKIADKVFSDIKNLSNDELRFLIIEIIATYFKEQMIM